MYAGIAGVLTAIVIVVAIFAASSKSTANTTPSAEAPAKPKPKPVKTTADPKPSAPTVRKAQVVVAVEPLDATILQDGEEIGNSPLLLQIPEGESVKLEITRDGFKPQQVEVDGSKQKRIVKLEKKPGAKVRPVVRPKPHPAKPKPKPKPKPAITDPGLVNPWGE